MNQGPKRKTESSLKKEFIYTMNLSVKSYFDSVFDLQINNSGTCLS